MSQKVTNLKIFSSSLPIEKMESITRGEDCDVRGDYLTWEDMEWASKERNHEERRNVFGEAFG